MDHADKDENTYYYTPMTRRRLARRAMANIFYRLKNFYDPVAAFTFGIIWTFIGIAGYKAWVNWNNEILVVGGFLVGLVLVPTIVGYVFFLIYEIFRKANYE